MKQHRHNTPSWRTGFCDGIFARPCISPYRAHHLAAQYLAGFMAGDEARLKFNIKSLAHNTATIFTKEWGENFTIQSADQLAKKEKM